MDTVPGTLRQWALIADSIAALQCNHEQRIKRISSFIGIVESYQHINRPLWQETIIGLLKQSLNHRMNYSHSEVRGLLILVGEICQHVAGNYDKWWLEWVQEPLREDTRKPPPKDKRPNPFLEYFEDDEDEDATQS